MCNSEVFQQVPLIQKDESESLILTEESARKVAKEMTYMCVTSGPMFCS